MLGTFIASVIDFGSALFQYIMRPHPEALGAQHDFLTSWHLYLQGDRKTSFSSTS